MTDDPNRLEAFTMDGVAYKGRPVLVQQLQRLLSECETTGRADPPDVQKLHDTIEAQSKTVETLQLVSADMAKTIETQEAKIVELKAGGDSGESATSVDNPPPTGTSDMVAPAPTNQE